MEHSDKVLPYRGNSYQNKRRRKKDAKKPFPAVILAFYQEQLEEENKYLAT
jgi:hypothetical protein